MEPRDEEEPLQDEAAKREDWRGGDSRPRPQSGGGGHTLPASEDGDEGVQEGSRDAVAHPPTVPPPD